MGKNSQLWYTDFIIALSIFLLVMVLAFKYIANNSLFMGESPIASEAARFSDSLMTEGIPANWTIEQVTNIGILDSESSINLTKLEQVNNMSKGNYSTIKSKFAMSSDFVIYFENRDGLIINLTDQKFIGMPGMNTTNVDSLEPDELTTVVRYVVYRHDNIAEIVALKILLWDEND